MKALFCMSFHWAANTIKIYRPEARAINLYKNLFAILLTLQETSTKNVTRCHSYNLE